MRVLNDEKVAAWVGLGLPRGLAYALVDDGCTRLADLAARGQAHFELVPGIGAKGRDALERLMGWAKPAD